MDSIELYSISGERYTYAPAIPKFRCASKKLPTIFLISGACTAWPWVRGEEDSIAALLHAQKRDVVVRPLHGFSGSPEDVRKFRWKPVMEDLRKEVSSIIASGRRVQLVGYSLGTFAAIQLATDRSFRISGMQAHDPTCPLVLFNPPFVLNDWGAKCLDWIYRKTGCFDSRSSSPPEDSLLLRAFLAVRYGFGDVKIAKEYLSRILPLKELEPELQIEGPLIYDRWPTIALARYLLQIPVTLRMLLEIECPVRILSSELDQLAKPVNSLETLLNPKVLPLSILMKIADGGHFWLMQDSESRRLAVRLICDSV